MPIRRTHAFTAPNDQKFRHILTWLLPLCWCQLTLPGWASQYQISWTPSHGYTQRVQVTLSVKGTLKLNPAGEGVKSLPLSVAAKMQYDEKYLSSQPPQTVRHYQEAVANIKIGQADLKRRLDDAKRSVSVRVEDGNVSLDSLVGHLTVDEFDLINVQANSLLLPQILPPSPVEIGDHWQLDRALLASLLCLDDVNRADVEGTLKEVNGNVAVLHVAGSVSGAAGGVSAELELKGTYDFDLDTKRISRVALVIRENRAIGHAEPGFEVMAQVQLALQPMEQSHQLADITLSDIKQASSAGKPLLVYQNSEGGFRLLHDRRWQVMVDQGHVSILRMIDRGDLLAQCNVSRLTELPAGQQLDLAKFQADVQKTLGDKAKQLVEASQSKTANGHYVLRVVATGQVVDLPIQWIYYHVADDGGRRASLVFTLEEKYVERFAGADRLLVSSLDFTAKSAPSAQSPTRAAPATQRSTARPAPLKR